MRETETETESVCCVLWGYAIILVKRGESACYVVMVSFIIWMDWNWDMRVEY